MKFLRQRFGRKARWPVEDGLSVEEIENRLGTLFQCAVNRDAIRRVAVISQGNFVYNRVKKNANSFVALMLSNIYY